MKKISTIFHLLLMSMLLLIIGTNLQAQMLIEDFTTATTTVLTSAGWTQSGGTSTNPLTIGSATGITFTGYSGSGVGNAVPFTTTGQDVYKTFPADSVGSVYSSFLVNVSAAQTGDYFYALSPSTSQTNYYGRLFIKQSGAGFVIGVSKSNETAIYGTTVFSLNTTYLAVIKHTFDPANDTNDVINVYLLPDGTSLTTEPAVPELADTGHSKSDTKNLGIVTLRQGGTSSSATLTIDGIRIGTSWNNTAGGINAPIVWKSPVSLAFGGVNVNQMKYDTILVKNVGYAALNVTSVTSSNSVFTVTPATATIAASDSQKFAVKYAPTSVIADSAGIAFVSDATSSPDTVWVKGSGVQAGFTASASTLNFGNVWKDSTKTDTIIVSNSSTSLALTIDSVVSSNALFTISPTTGTVGISSADTFTVTFAPTAKGNQSGNLIFYSNAPTIHDTVKVTAKGIEKKPEFTANSSKDFHGVLVGTAWKDSITVTNSGYDSLLITAISSSDPTFTITPSTASIDSQASTKFYITFTPSAVGMKSSAIVFTSNVAESTDTVTAVGRGMTFVTIAEARKDLNNDLIADYSVSKDTLAIYGTITTQNMGASASQTSFFLQDSTAGIDGFAFGLPPVTYSRGDSVLIIGTLAQFRGLVEFSPVKLDTTYFKIIKHNATVPKPKRLTLHQFVANAESYEGQLVEVDSLYKTSGTWPAAGIGNVSIFVTNEAHTDTAQVFLDFDAGIGGFAEPVYPMNVVAIVSQFSSASTVYNNGYELAPRDSFDIIKTRLAASATIAEARKDANNDFIADHSVTKDTLAIYAVITTPNMGASASQTSYFAQDATGGIDLFAFGLPPVAYAKGDSVRVVGTVSQFKGLVEFSPLALDTSYFKILKHNATVPKAKHLTLHQFATNAESYEGQLIELDSLYKTSGTWPGAGVGNVSVYLTSAAHTDTVQMFLDLDASIGGSTEPAYPIKVVGIVSQYSSVVPPNNGYEISPRDTADISHTIVAGVDNAYSGIPETYQLFNNYPNPFNPSTTIKFGLPFSSVVSVKIYDVLGREIATLVNGELPAGYHDYVWNAGSLSSGMYLYRIEAKSIGNDKSQTFTDVKKLLLMK